MGPGKRGHFYFALDTSLCWLDFREIYKDIIGRHLHKLAKLGLVGTLIESFRDSRNNIAKKTFRSTVFS